VGNNFEDKVTWELGDGESIFFWEDKWVENGVLRVFFSLEYFTYPRLKWRTWLRKGSSMVIFGSGSWIGEGTI